MHKHSKQGSKAFRGSKNYERLGCCKLRVDIIDVMNRLKNIVEKAEKLDPKDVEISDRVLENRIIVLEGYLNFFEQSAIPNLKRISQQLEQLEQNIFVGGKEND